MGPKMLRLIVKNKKLMNLCVKNDVRNFLRVHFLISRQNYKPEVFSAHEPRERQTNIKKLIGSLQRKQQS